MAPRARRLSALLALVAALLAWGAFRATRPPHALTARASLSVSSVLASQADSGFARALEPRPFEFPADHGAHPAFRSEWWYLTGNLEGPEGEPYGFQLTFFRGALRPEGGGAPTAAAPSSAAPEPPSAWATRQAFMGHFAVSDGRGGAFHAFERFARGALGLAGAQSEPLRVWVEDWVLEGPATAGGEIFPLTLRAREGGVELALTVTPSKPMALQGDRGLSQKGPEPGNASYYYSFTRLEATGELALEGSRVPVRGTAWLDREWSTSALSPGQVGWDWFALQLDDGHDLTVYRLRRQDGSADPLSKGSWVGPGGEMRVLGAPEVELEVLERWASPLDGTLYPARWRLAVPGEELELEVVPLLSDQELALTFRYWEGAVRVTGTRRGRGVSGVGYVELTGYADAPARPAGLAPTP